MSISFRLAFSHALICGVALTTTLPLAAPTIAVAQSVQPERTVFGVRFLGEWVDDYGLRYVFTDEGLGRLKGEVTRAASGEVVARIEWLPTRDGMGGNFFVPNASPSETVNDRGITGYVDHAGRAVLVVRAGRFPNGHAVPSALDLRVRGGIPERMTQGNVFPLRRPDGHPTGEDSARWSGRWRTTRGQLELRPEGRNLFGALKQGERLVATERLAMLGDAGGVASGAWEREGEWTPNVDRGDLTLRLSADGRSFSGWYTDVTRTGNTRIPWTGERIDDPSASTAANSPAPSQPAAQEPIPTASSSANPPASGPAQPSPPPAAGGFKPLNRVDVRVDRVVVARGYPTYQVHAFITVKNTSAVPQYFTSGFLKAVLADADGVSWERSQPYRASGEPAELFGSTPVIQPGGELRARFVFVPEADAHLTSLTLSEGGKQAEFPVGGL